MNNSMFGKTMANVRNRVNVKIVCSDEKEKIRKMIASPLFARCTLVSNNLAGFRMHEESVKLDKSAYVGMTILDNSKILRYDFYCSELKR